MPNRKIGYIGLGNMGGGMAAHLLSSGYDVVVYDLRPEAVQAQVDRGASAADTLHGRSSLKTKTFARNFDPGFKLALSHKDLGLAAQLAASLGASNMIGSAAYQVQTLAMGKGLGNEDQTATVKIAEETLGVEVRGRDAD